MLGPTGATKSASSTASRPKTDTEPEFWTGVRKFESQRRLRTVSGPHQPAERWVWRSPLYDWRDHQIEDYLQDHGLPRNSVVETLHRSGECHCGAFANRNKELALLETHYPEFAGWLLSVERHVQDEIGTDEPWCFWGHAGLPSPQLRALMAEHDTAQMTLCDSCRIEEVVKA